MKKSWLHPWFERRDSSSRELLRRRTCSSRLLVERLEDRLVPAIFSVDTDQVFVNENDFTALIVVSRQVSPGPSLTADTIDFTTVAGSATAGSDYTLTAGTLTFPPNTLTGAIDTMTISVPIINDSLDEADETFTVTLSNPSAGSSLASPSAATVTIIDDGASIDNGLPIDTIGHFGLTVNEGGGSSLGSTTAQGVNQLFIDSDFVFDFSNFVDVGSDGTALNLGDTTQNGPVMTLSPGVAQSTGSFAGQNGQVSWTVTTRIAPGSPVIENVVTFSSSAPLGNLRFINYLDEDVASVSDDILALFGTPGGPDFLAFTLDNPERVGFGHGGVYSPGPGLVNANYDGFAADEFSELRDAITGTGTTYTPAGNIDQTSLPPVFDPALNTTVFGPADVTTAFAWTVDPTATTATITTILQLVPSSTLSIDDVLVPETDSGIAAAVFNITLSRPSTQDTFVTFSTRDGTATAPADYQAVSQTTLTIPAGQTSATVTVPVVGETLFEADESFFVDISVLGNVTVLKSVGQGTIVNDDTAPTLSIGDVSSAEGDSGVTDFPFVLTLSEASGFDTTFNVSTPGGTATPDVDYVPTGSVFVFDATIPAGQTSITFPIRVIGDLTTEPDETFLFNLSNPVNATLADGTGTGLILNDDGPPTVDIIDVMPDPRTSPVASLDIVFSEAVTGFDEADLTLTNDPDGTGPGAPVLVSLAGATLSTLDNITYTLTGLAGATGQSGSYVLTLTAAGSGITDAGGNPLAADATDAFDIDLVAPTAFITPVTPDPRLVPVDTVTIAFTEPVLGFDLGDLALTRDGTPVDISAANLAGPGGQTFTLSGLAPFTTTPGSYVLTLDETTAGITDMAGNALALGASEAFTVGAPAVTLGDVSIPEGNAAATLTLVAVLTPAAPVDVVFPFATRDGTATAGSDYTPTTGMLTIPAGQTTGTIDVTVLGETLFEGDETFFLDVGTATATVTLANDDPAPAVSIGSASLTEGNTPGTPTPLVFPVTLSAASAVPVVLSFTTADGTATAGSDYTATTGTLTIAAGQTTSSLTVAVPVLGDTTVEPDETFLVNLSVASGGATPATGQATGTIVNDDQPPANSVFQVTALTPSVVENQASIQFMVTRSVPGGSSSGAATVSFSLGGTAVRGLDYSVSSTTVSFAAGESSKTVTLAVVNDAVFEENESVVLTLTSPTGGSVGAPGSATATLVDDEARFIDALYMKVLGRPADPLGRSSAILVLAPNNTIGARSLVADFIQQSPEGKAVIIDRLYSTVLDRPADPEARVLGVRALDSGVGEADIAVFLLASDEFGARHPGNAAYVAELVRLTFGTEPTAAEVAAGVSALDTGLRSRATLAYQLLSTERAFGQAVDNYFEFYLERFADAPTRDSLVAALATGNFDPRRAAFVFIGSDEFYLRAVNGLLTFRPFPPQQ